jgi:hypothetical protein
MGLGFFKPLIIIGNLLFSLSDKSAPNLFKGSAILLKSLLDKLSSPIILILWVELINKPGRSLARVPEFFALIIIFFLYLYPFRPLP